jgi:Ca2+-binding EF-hand superfamily protein
MKAFKSFDKDGNGTIDREELGELMVQLGMAMDPDEVNEYKLVVVDK